MIIMTTRRIILRVDFSIKAFRMHSREEFRCCSKTFTCFDNVKDMQREASLLMLIPSSVVPTIILV